MKKKNLIILLLIPFLIALLGIVTLSTTFILVENDLVGISWNYDDIEAFELREDLYELKAEGINQKNYPAGSGNNLVWTCKNENNEEEPHATIVKRGSKYYLQTLSEGNIIVTCSTEKGNIFKTMSVVIYSGNVIIITPLIKGSQSNIDNKIYYGEYDLANNQKINAKIQFEIKTISDSVESVVQVVDKTSNIQSVDVENKTITLGNVKKNEPASLTLGLFTGVTSVTTTYSFVIVNDGVNVYTYDDLLNCTNRSENGEIVVLRKSFESLDNAYFVDNDDEVLLSNGKPVLKENNVECFGNYDPKTKQFNFKDEIYRFITTYNKNFIDAWNDYMESKNSTNTIDEYIKVGLHVQKDFYGNGYTINMHNLAYPSDEKEGKDGAGNVIIFPKLDVNDLFRGPLPFYTLGDHNNMPLVEAFGQDNIGMYVDGTNIVVNDVNIKNCDFGNMLSNLDTVGTVVEIYGENITIKNSRIANGKNVVRCFSSHNVTIDNSMLSNSRNFLLQLGANEYIPIDVEKEMSFLDLDGIYTLSNVNSYFTKGAAGDNLLNAFVATGYETEAKMNATRASLLKIQDNFNNEDLVKEVYKGSVVINDTYFYQSGIASIALDTLFNGPFLESATPTEILEVLQMLSTQDGISLSKFIATHLSGQSYPIKVEILGKTKFYDYKNINNIDITGLISENISAFAGSVDPGFAGEVNIDKIFPVKQYLTAEAKKNNNIYVKDGSSYINIPIAYYGGGLNLSTVNTDGYIYKNYLGNVLTVDFLDSYLKLESSSNLVTKYKNMMLKSVTTVIGYEPFKFVCTTNDGYLYGETPKVSDLIENAKGE